MPRILFLFISLVLSTAVYAQIKPFNTSIVPQPTRTLDPVPNAYTNVNLNYIRTWSPLVPFTDASDASMNAKTNQQVRQETSFFDRMGREIQLVKRGVTSAGKDIIYAKKIEPDGKEHYMYLPYPSSQYSGSFRNAPFIEQHAFYSTPSLNENRFSGEKVYYAENIFEQSPLNRVIKEMPVGNSWAGSNRGVSTNHILNTAAEKVIKWGVTDAPGNIPSINGTYPANILTKTSTRDAHGKRSIVYKDIEGKIILQKEEVTAGGIENQGWLCTYFVYDDFGLLRLILPPKFIQQLTLNPSSSKWNLVFQSGSFYDLYFIFEYDQLGRKVFEKVPGKEAIEMVYDNRDRVVFTSDGRDRAADRWKMNSYDHLNRIVMEGLYSSSKSRTQLQSEMDLLPAAGQVFINYGALPPVDLVISSRNTNVTEYKATGSIVFEDGFSSVSGDEFEAIVNPEAAGTVQASIYNPLPALPPADVTPLKYYYYDNYSWVGNKPFFAADIQKPQQGDNIQKDNIVKSDAVSGYLTGTGVRVLGTSQWLYTTRYYDEKGRVIQTISDNAAGGVETTTNLYDFNNKLISSYLRHTKPGNPSTPETRILNIDNYDHAGRLKSSVVKLNDDNSLERIIANNTYYETGELKNKNLGGIRDISYDYSIGGHLKSINKDYINGTGSGSFGEELFYDYGYTENQFTGEIAGIIWRGDGPARSYGYEYDPTGRLNKADFTQKDGNGNWVQSVMDYSVLGPDSTNGRIRYDGNGNLLNIIRKGGVSVNVDVLSYQYYDKSNRLKNVTDANNNPSSTLGDFKEIISGQPVDYTYDQNGNLTKDENKGITEITYNELNLPASITITGKGTIYYKYDANGIRLEKRIVDNTGTNPVEKKFEYIDGLVYENEVLKYILHDEGRIRVIQKLPQPIAYYYDYFIKDHLNNVRIVYSEQTDLSTYSASMEPASSTRENLLFNNIDRSRTDRPSGYPADSSNKYVAKLNAKDPNKRIGPSLVLKVMAGDTIWAKVNAFYKSQEPSQRRTSDVAIDMLSPLLQAFEGNVSSPGKTIGISNGMPFNENFTSGPYQRLKEKQSDDKSQDRPKAYLNYILFDEQLNMVDENSGVKQIQSSPDEIQQLVKDGIEVSRNGYLYVYTSNESQQDVYFDDLIVIMSTGRLNEETHYYPFGLIMKGISSKAITAPTYPENNIRYNSKELQASEFADGTGLEWYDYGARMYDPQIGRWHAIDNASKDFYNLTPFGYCANNPIANVDVDGNTHIPINVMKLVMRNWYQRSMFREWQTTTVEGMSYALSRQRANEMHKSFRQVNQSKISDRSRSSESDASPGMTLFRGMSELLIGMTPVLGSSVRALKALKGGDTGGAMLNTIFAFTEGAAMVGGLHTTASSGGSAAVSSATAKTSSASLARSWQGKGSYLGVDNWRNISLKGNTYVVGGLPGQSEYYTTMSGLKRSGMSASKLWQGLQVEAHSTFGYRMEVGVYRAKGTMNAAFGTSYANTQFGSGGLPQLFIPNYNNLELVNKMFLTK